MFGLKHLLLNRKPDIEFVSHLSIDECQKQLAKEFKQRIAILGLDPFHPNIGWLKGNHFLVCKNQTFLFREVYYPVLDGYLEIKNEGTLVCASFRLNRLISTLIILSFALFFGMAVSEVFFHGAQLELLLIPIFLWAFWGLTIWLLYWRVKSKRDILVSYLKSILTPIAHSG